MVSAADIFSHLHLLLPRSHQWLPSEALASGGSRDPAAWQPALSSGSSLELATSYVERWPTCPSSTATDSPDTVKASARVEEVYAPEGIDRCCHGRHTVADVAELDNYQEVPYGTHAWSKSYGQRSRIEMLNKLLKVERGLGDNAFMCASGHEAHELAAIALGVAHNIEVSERFAEDQTAVERGDEELPPCDEIVLPPKDTYFSGRLPKMTQEPPGGEPPS